MSYNLTGISRNASNVYEFAKAVNNNLMLRPGSEGGTGLLFLLILIGLAVIMYMSFMASTGDSKKAGAATAFITFGLSVLLSMLDLVPYTTLFVTLIGAAFIIAFTWKE